MILTWFFAEEWEDTRPPNGFVGRSKAER